MSGLLVNYFECSFEAYKYTVNMLDYSEYDTKEKYRLLRESHRNFAFARYGNSIFYWRLKPNAEDDLQGKEVTIKANEYPFIYQKIFESALIALLENFDGYSIRLDKYSNVWRITKDKDLLSPKIEGLMLQQQIGVNTFYRQVDKEIRFGLVISARIEHRFSWSRKDFENHGIDTSYLKGRDDKVFANRHALKHFLAARGVNAEYTNQFEKLRAHSRQIEVVNTFLAWIDKKKAEIFLPGGNRLVKIEKKYLPFSGITREVFAHPKRYYYEQQIHERTRLSFDQQIKKYKPFSYELFANKPVKIGVLCPRQFEGVTEGFVTMLENKLRNDLHVRQIEFVFRFVKDLNLASYKDVLYDDELLSCNLVIVVVTEAQEALRPKDSPYFVCKAKYIGNGIPTQDIQVKNIKKRNQYVLNNLALNIYAKLGGTAWVIEKEEKRKEELIIGIGSTLDRSGRQVLGIAQVFNSDGRYIVGDCAPLSNFDNYTENLSAYLVESLERVIANHIDQRSEVRLIFHLFKSASNRYEIKAINDAVGQFENFNFSYALLHLGYSHNFRLYNDDGQQSVAKGMFVKLDDHAALLHFVPKSCVPLYIRLDKRSTFTDIYYLSKQVYWFSHLSHRSYNPAKKTVTIMYPSLMANLTEKLKQVDGWDYDRLNKVAEKLWFI